MKYFNFNNSYLNLDKKIYTKINPDSVKSPNTIIYNYNLSNRLGVTDIDSDEYLSGNKVLDGSEPLAQAYAGHQFGYLNILGDGRAILLGEHLDPLGNRFDIQLKGSGRTPYSRGGDGKATLSSMLREYIISHSMYSLGIPTTESLAVVETGEPVYRETEKRGAVLTRVASSHLRVGTFQFIALQGDLKLLKEFTDYVINRHYPELKGKESPYLKLLDSVMIKQIDLIINWMRVGFIHGVMNTDNMSISGETIDYGPCAFMDTYNPNTVFSSIDKSGRYSFFNQKKIGQWNIARFAETLVPLIDPNSDIALQLVNEVVQKYIDEFNIRWKVMMGKKLGLSKDYNLDIVNDLLSWMEKNKSDYTKVFRTLLKEDFLKIIPNSNNELEEWYLKWNKLSIDKKLIESNNPSVIPRNHLVEEALLEADNNNSMDKLNRLLEVLGNPYKDVDNKYYTDPPETVDTSYKTYCGT